MAGNYFNDCLRRGNQLQEGVDDADASSGDLYIIGDNFACWKWDGDEVSGPDILFIWCYGDFDSDAGFRL